MIASGKVRSEEMELMEIDSRRKKSAVTRVATLRFEGNVSLALQLM